MASPLVIIGEAPGKEELRANKPFIGRSGKLLRAALERAGIDPDMAYFTNAMRCMPPSEGTPKTTQYRAGIEACRERLTEEVLAYPRTLIFTLGNSANRGFLGDFNFKITGKRGQPIDLEELGVVLPTFHPASIMRNQGEYPRWAEDIKYAAKLLASGTDAIKHPAKPTAHIMLSEPDEVAHYPRPVTKWAPPEKDRAWNPRIIDGSQLVDWPIRKVYTGIPAAVRAINELLQKPKLSADIETGYSYSPRLGKVLALAVAWSPTDGIVFSEGLIESKGFRPHLKRLLTSPGPLWVGHNFKYDSDYLRNQILDAIWPEDGALVNYHDTLLEHYCLDETKGTHDLEQVARDVLGAEDYKKLVKKYTNNSNKAKGIEADLGYENVPREVLYPYSVLDTTHTFSIHEVLCPKVHESKGLTKLYNDLLLPASRFLQKVQNYGLYVNQEFVDELDGVLGGKVEKARLELIEEVKRPHRVYRLNEKGMKHAVAQTSKPVPLWSTTEFMASRWATKKVPTGYNPNYWAHTAFLLYRLIGWTPMNVNERTLRDLDQTGKDQSATFGYKAKNYARGHPNRKIKLNFPYIQALIDYRLAAHAYRMMVTGIRKNTEPDGRLHTTFNLQATETGRLSSTGPNLQNLPVPEKDDPNPYRNIVGSPPGRVLIEADYSQVELRLLAHFSNDSTLIQVYKDGRDLHTELSIAIWGDREFDAEGKQIAGYTNYQRVRAKAVNFGIAYGRGAGSIAAEHDIPEADAEEMRQAWFAQFPQAAAWLRQLQQAPLTGRTIISKFGRRRRFGMVSRDNLHELANQSTNFPMQSHGTDLTLLSAMRIQQKWDREGTDAHIVCLVHDALVAECPAEIAEQTVLELKAMMEDTPMRILRPPIDFPVDVHTGTVWGTMKTEEMADTKITKGKDVTTFGKAGVASGKL